MKITISGEIGSGKTTVGKILAKKLKLKFISIGDLRGKMAKKKGLDINKLNKLGERDPSTDLDADKEIIKLSKKDNILVEGRMGYHFIPDSFKIFLKVNPIVGAERTLKTNRSDEKYKNVKDALAHTKARMKSDTLRYKKYYNTNWRSMKNYDIVIDTTKLSINSVIEKIIKKIK